MAFSNPTPPPSVPFPSISARDDVAFPKPKPIPGQTDPPEPFPKPYNTARTSSGLGTQQAAPYRSSNVIVTNNNTNRTVPVVTPNNSVVPTPVRQLSQPVDRRARFAAEMARRRANLGFTPTGSNYSAQGFTGEVGSPRGEVRPPRGGDGGGGTPARPQVPQPLHLTLPGQGEVGGAWGAGMYPEWYQRGIEESGISPEQAANQFANYVRAHPEIDFGWYWNSFRRGGDYYGGQYSF